VRDKGEDLWGKNVMQNRRYTVAIALGARKILKSLSLEKKLNRDAT
jgi:hypothetical protein